MAENNNDTTLQAPMMDGRFTASHNPAVVGLRASNLNLILIGYVNYGTRAEVWTDYSWIAKGPSVTAKLRPKIRAGDKWNRIRWIDIAEFVPWVYQIKEQGGNGEEINRAILSNWHQLYSSPSLGQPSMDATAAFPVTIPIPLTLHAADAELIDPSKEPTTKRLEELSQIIFGTHYGMDPVPKARMMLALREHRVLCPMDSIFRLPSLMAWFIATKQHPDFTHPGRK